ncbi:amino acid racemase [Candidatus Woesebacteria bacterium]|nr:amino acid racemase [Candidatus Woesebacteria bacterium]
MVKKSIGILGGMGPDASASLYLKMIEKARTQFGAEKNDEYPDIILNSVPVPDFISNKKNMPRALKMLEHSVDVISPACICLGIACNTAHLLIPELQKRTPVPFVSMIEAVSHEVKKRKYKKVGLLATPTTFHSGMYQTSIGHSAEVLVPTDAQVNEMGEIVNQVLAGDFVNTPKKLVKIADELKERGCEAIVLGCTELPLVFPDTYVLPSLSSLDFLTQALLEVYYAQK